jgi:hypothetical protein
MKQFLNEGNQIHNFISSSGSGTVINYGSGSGSDFLTSYGFSSGSTSQKVTVPTVPVPVPQRCLVAELGVVAEERLLQHLAPAPQVLTQRQHQLPACLFTPPALL